MRECVYAWYPGADEILARERRHQQYHVQVDGNANQDHADEWSRPELIPKSVKIQLTPRPVPSDFRYTEQNVYNSTAASNSSFQAPLFSHSHSAPSNPKMRAILKDYPANKYSSSCVEEKTMNLKDNFCHSSACEDESGISTPAEVQRSYHRSRSAIIKTAPQAHPLFPSTASRLVKSAGPFRFLPQRETIGRPTTFEPTETEQVKYHTPDYEEQLKKHGWKMEVHGDPLDLKQRCLLKRPALFVSVPRPPIKPKAPVATMTTRDTFFYNTIPRHKASYSLHPEWLSEILHTKRMELQKRDDGFKYNTREFSFVY